MRVRGRRTTATRQPTVDRWVYVRLTVPAGQTLNICGFEFMLRSVNASSARIQTALHSANPDTSPGGRLFSGTEVFVDATQRWCATWFPARAYAAGTILYLAYRNPSTTVSLAEGVGGADAQWYEGNVRQTNRPWKYRVLCGGATPNMSALGQLPWIGRPFALHCDNVPQGGWALLWLGPPTGTVPVDLRSAVAVDAGDGASKRSTRRRPVPIRRRPVRCAAAGLARGSWRPGCPPRGGSW